MTIRSLLIAALFAGALSGCSERQVDRLPPSDRLYFPNGVATTRVSGGATALLVANTNFDLRYSAEDGGTLISADPVASSDAGPLTLVGAPVPIGSYGGPIAIADASTCALFPARPVVAVTASRYDDVVYQLSVDGAGAPSCGPGCLRSRRADLKDPFAVAVACAGGLRRGFVAYLEPPFVSNAVGTRAWITEWDLDSPGPTGRDVELGDGPVRGLAFDWNPGAANPRLWATTLSSGARTLLHAVALSDPRWDGPSPRDAVETIDIFPDARGTELRSVAVGTSPASGVTRLFLTAVLYDADAQASTGGRGGATGGVLLVLDVSQGNTGRLVHSLRAVTPLGLGAGDVRIVRRLGGADLAVVTASDDDVVMLYDDATGGVAWLEAHDSVGAPVMGDRPVAIAVDQPTPGGIADVYVAGFGNHVVTRFNIDPSNPAVAPTIHRIGGLAP